MTSDETRPGSDFFRVAGRSRILKEGPKNPVGDLTNMTNSEGILVSQGAPNLGPRILIYRFLYFRPFHDGEAAGTSRR